MANNNETYHYRKLSLGDIQEQSNLLYNARAYPISEQQREYSAPSEQQQYIPPHENAYFAEQYPNADARNTLPYLYNTSDNLLNDMVGINNDNFIVFGSSNAEKVPKSMNFVEQTNGNLSGVDYPIDYSDYNLFSNAGVNSLRQQFDSPTMDHAGAQATTTPHLIQNLVGHWGSGGNYTPFGSSVKNMGEFGGDRVIRKPRMVAEVRPMRPSYSDVLAKSAPNQKPGKQTEGTAKTTDVKNGKASKCTVGRSLSGSASGNGSTPLPNRQNCQGDDQSSNQKLLNRLKKWMEKKERSRDEPLMKTWVSLDDLNGEFNDSNFMREETPKKATAKVAPSKKAKENWEPMPMSNGKPASGKSFDAKKANGNSNGTPKVQPVLRDKDMGFGVKAEVSKNKSAEERKGGPSVSSTAQGKAGEAAKVSRRNSRGVQADKSKKTIKVKKRETPHWAVLPLVTHRLDLALAWLFRAATWLITLVLDVFALSTHLALYMFSTTWQTSVTAFSENYSRVGEWFKDLSLVKRIAASKFWPFRYSERLPPPSEDDDEDDSDSESGDGKKKKKRLPGGLKHNLPLPSTGDEAMKRLLACKGKDPYSILGVSQDCTDDDIKKYYKRQAFLVHPDKNNQPGAEEAFKILVHAFDIIGEPEHRKSYDLSVEKTAQAEQAWSELSELLAQLHKKMEYVANTLRCTNCGKRHKRSIVNRPIYAARMCSQCNIHHSVREGDIWAETSVFGLMWRYLACMDGSVYDISEWAACQGGNLKNLKANTHQVQYRIVLGKHAQKGRSHQSSNSAEPDLEEFINNLYTKPESGNSGEASGETRNKKHRRKK